MAALNLSAGVSRGLLTVRQVLEIKLDCELQLSGRVDCSREAKRRSAACSGQR